MRLRRPGAGGCMASVMQLRSACDGGHMRRLFNVEPDNQYKETLLLAQIAAQQLLQLPISVLQDAACQQRLTEWGGAACQVCAGSSLPPDACHLNFA